MRALFIGLRALVYASVFVLIWWWGAVQLRPFDERLGVPVPPWFAATGLVLACLGALLGLSCVYAFVRFGGGTPAPFDPPREFVATGPYRYVRNPMYIGGLLVIFGGGLAIRSVSIALLAVVFFGVMHLFVVLYEEPSLERRFGRSYIDYKKSVRRWSPAFSRRV